MANINAHNMSGVRSNPSQPQQPASSSSILNTILAKDLEHAKQVVSSMDLKNLNTLQTELKGSPLSTSNPILQYLQEAVPARIANLASPNTVERPIAGPSSSQPSQDGQRLEQASTQLPGVTHNP